MIVHVHAHVLRITYAKIVQVHVQVLRMTSAVTAHVLVQSLNSTQAASVRDLFRFCVLHAQNLSMPCPEAAYYMRNAWIRLVQLLYKFYPVTVCVYEILHKTACQSVVDIQTCALT